MSQVRSCWSSQRKISVVSYMPSIVLVTFTAALRTYPRKNTRMRFLDSAPKNHTSLWSLRIITEWISTTLEPDLVILQLLPEMFTSLLKPSRLKAEPSQGNQVQLKVDRV
ncbi:hypothetical protein Ccrd_012251 [Cynara cardunculus var. scolymus]|uniref:Uncharacterized protein n=1 Tax=Cynara cardunculus var. scolymus TaxID=59895 RepID=A0A103YHW2_CYNCS|nr:hypothetical protein Ccrd_012251 [Cynara cardunculus var. scolymus]